MGCTRSGGLSKAGIHMYIRSSVLLAVKQMTLRLRGVAALQNLTVGLEKDRINGNIIKGAKERWQNRIITER